MASIESKTKHKDIIKQKKEIDKKTEEQMVDTLERIKAIVASSSGNNLTNTAVKKAVKKRIYTGGDTKIGMEQAMSHKLYKEILKSTKGLSGNK